MPTGKVKFFDKERGFGFVTRDDGGDVFLPAGALPSGVDELRSGARVEFGVAEGRRGEQALSVRLLDPPPRLATARRPADELHGMVEDMVKVLESQVQRPLRVGRYPDRKQSQRVADLVHAVARELEQL